VDVAEAEEGGAAVGNGEDIAVFVDDEFVEEMRGVEFSVADDIVAMQEIELDEEIGGGVRREIMCGDIEFVQVAGHEMDVREAAGGSAGAFEGMDVEEAGLVLQREPDEPGQEPPAAGQGGVDEAEVAAGGFYAIQACEHFVICVWVIA